MDHRGNYWRISDHERTVSAATGHAAATLVDHEREDEGPSYEEWQEYAVDPQDADE